ncbi:MAG: hypothetical protein QM766_03635 [Burkholderiaceae bacterium]
MFIIPLILFPIVLAAVLYRLWTLPRRYLKGEARLAHPKKSLLTFLTLVAYLGLLAYTIVLMFLIGQLAFSGHHTLEDWLSVALTAVGFPIMYVAAEWVFFYGFERPKKPGSEP